MDVVPVKHEVVVFEKFRPTDDSGCFMIWLLLKPLNQTFITPHLTLIFVIGAATGLRSRHLCTLIMGHIFFMDHL